MSGINRDAYGEQNGEDSTENGRNEQTMAVRLVSSALRNEKYHWASTCWQSTTATYTPRCDALPSSPLAPTDPEIVRPKIRDRSREYRLANFRPATCTRLWVYAMCGDSPAIFPSSLIAFPFPTFSRTLLCVPLLLPQFLPQLQRFRHPSPLCNACKPNPGMTGLCLASFEPV